MKILLLFLVFIFSYSLSQAPLKIPLRKIQVSLQGLSGISKITTPNLKRTNQKTLQKLLKSNFFFLKYYISLETPQNKRFLVSISTNFAGLWLKDTKCYDCTLSAETPKCSYKCESGALFQNNFECDNCNLISKKATIPQLAKLIKKSKSITADLKIDLLTNFFQLNQIPLILAQETRNVKFIQADGQFGLLSDSNKKTDVVSWLIKNKIIADNGFSVVLNPKDDEKQRTSFILLGGSDNTIITENSFQNMSFNPKNFTFLLKNIEIDSEKAFKKLTVLKGIIDIDKNYIGLPKEALSLFLKKIKGTCDFIGKLIFCSLEESISKSESLSISFISAQNNVFSLPIKNLLQCKSIPEVRLSNYCLLKVRETKNLTIGSPFFEKFQGYFNKENLGLGSINTLKLKNFVQVSDIFQSIYLELYLFIAGAIIMVLLAILAYLVRRRVFNYSNIKPVENSLNIDQNDGISMNNESFIGGDSFHFEYELPEIKKNEPILPENLTPITRKYMLDKQQDEKEQKEQKEIEKIEGQEKEKEKNSGEEIKKIEVYDEKTGFNSLAEENEKKSETNISENKEENEQNEENGEKKVEKVPSLEKIKMEIEEINRELVNKENS